MVVDLPAPLGPRKPWTSPGDTVRSRPSSARNWPNVLTRPRTEMTAVSDASMTRFCRATGRHGVQRAAQGLEGLAVGLADGVGLALMLSRSFGE